jgi:hypothetical protein
MSNRSVDEKDEKRGEKDEKDEKEVQKRDEKSVEEKYRNDPPNTITWAVILIWAGLCFLADNLGWLAKIPVINLPDTIHINGLQVWTVIMLGAGVIMLFNVLGRVLIPAYRKPVGGTLMLAAIFFGVGLGNLFGWNVVWPLILIAIGLSFILRGMFRRM